MTRRRCCSRRHAVADYNRVQLADKQIVLVCIEGPEVPPRNHADGPFNNKKTAEEPVGHFAEQSPVDLADVSHVKLHLHVRVATEAVAVDAGQHPMPRWNRFSPKDTTTFKHGLDHIHGLIVDHVCIEVIPCRTGPAWIPLWRSGLGRSHQVTDRGSRLIRIFQTISCGGGYCESGGAVDGKYRGRSSFYR